MANEMADSFKEVVGSVGDVRSTDNVTKTILETVNGERVLRLLTTQPSKLLFCEKRR